MRVFVGVVVFLRVFDSAIAQLNLCAPETPLQISVWQDPKLDRKIVVGPDGMISFPLAGHIRAGGLTPQQLENVLRGRLQKNYTGPLDVTVRWRRSIRTKKLNQNQECISQVRCLKPGPYILRPGTNVMQALAQAGGLGQFAARRRIQIHRQA